MMHKTILTAALCAAHLAATPYAGAATPAALPASMAMAAELAAMPDGGWLALDKHGLRLLDAAGAERGRVSMRAKHLDTRPRPGGVLAMAVDSNTETPRLVDIDLGSGAMRPQTPFPAPHFGVEAACLYRDAQELDYLFLVAKDGQAEQWLMRGDERRLVRRLALPPRVHHCKVDDGSATLLASESGMGLWAYSADAEGAGGREALGLRPPFGAMAGGAAAITLLPGGAAALDGKGGKLHTFRIQDGHWHALPPRALKSPAGARALTARSGGHGPELLLADEDGGHWRQLPLAWPSSAAQGLPPTAIVLPRMQTEPVARLGDAADDPAIWVHATDPDAGRVLGTNKKQGLLVYDLKGAQTQLLEVGRLNNVDLRQNVLLDGARLDLAVATQRDDNTLILFTIDAGGTVAEAARFATGMEKIYGVCTYQPAGGGLEAFVNDKDGLFKHYRITRQNGAYAGTLLRSFRVASQPEGCVADDRTGRLFIGEEKRGVWTLAASGDAPASLKMVLPVGPQLKADVEGMSLYHGAAASYLVVSSQGDNSYVVLDALPPHKVRGRFRIGVNAALGIDGASETDGLDVSSANLGGPYASGMLVVQDGYKRLPDGPQNFKYVAWSDIASALGLP
ncbi:phytase [Pseudoduganella namucuonensis]|uniref:3-phytase n=1 Tax=Pseudoduganella namucuonensis TaxID=1035707 RepID=A0A1I7M264_9BURK|nr:phytase [Pseudoduganella namucuonensis]SFV16033.1 3-phytase [Pseudoduganella namucuonensis]